KASEKGSAKNLLLFGPPGTGKSAFLSAMRDAEGDLLEPRGGTRRQSSAVFLINEFSSLDPSLLQSVHSSLSSSVHPNPRKQVQDIVSAHKKAERRNG